jgi:hypothetical protein
MHWSVYLRTLQDAQSAAEGNAAPPEPLIPRDEYDGDESIELSFADFLEECRRKQRDTL